MRSHSIPSARSQSSLIQAAPSGLGRLLESSSLNRPLRTQVFAGLWLMLLAGVLAMTVWASVADHFPGDVAVGHWIQSNLAGRELSQFLRNVGSAPAAMVTIALAIGLLIAQRRCRVARLLIVLMVSLVLAALLKELVDRPRTSVLFLEQHGTFDSPSFPSGHTFASAIAGAVVLYVAARSRGPRWLRMPLAIWGLGIWLLQPWASVSAGVHWPSDVLGSLLWSAVVLAPVFFIAERWALPLDRVRPLSRLAILPLPIRLPV